MLPFLSVVLAVRDERAMLPRLVDELIRQNYPSDRFEILVVDGRSTDGTAELVRRRYAQSRVPVRVIDNPKVRTAAGRNLGIRAAQGDVILFIDGHCEIPSRNLLEDTAAILDRTGAACLCRPQPLAAPAATHTGEVIAQVRTNWLVTGRGPRTQEMKQPGFVDPVCSGSTYLRRVFYRTGLFDESFEAFEEIDFNVRVRRAGFRAYSDPRLAVHYQPRSSVRALFAQMVRHGRGKARLMRKHEECFSAGQMVPLAVLGALLLALLAWSFAPKPLALVASLPAAAAVLALLIATLQIFLQHGFASAWKAPLLFATIYAGMGLGMVAEFLTNAPSREAAGVADLLCAGGELRPLEPYDHAA